MLNCRGAALAEDRQANWGIPAALLVPLLQAGCLCRAQGAEIFRRHIKEESEDARDGCLLTIPS